jgi:hypothetical protein
MPKFTTVTDRFTFPSGEVSPLDWARSQRALRRHGLESDYPQLDQVLCADLPHDLSVEGVLSLALELDDFMANKGHVVTIAGRNSDGIQAIALLAVITRVASSKGHGLRLS